MESHRLDLPALCFVYTLISHSQIYSIQSAIDHTTLPLLLPCHDCELWELFLHYKLCNTEQKVACVMANTTRLLSQTCGITATCFD